MLIRTKHQSSFEIKELNGIATVECWGFPNTFYAFGHLFELGYKLPEDTKREVYPFNHTTHYVFFMKTPEDGTSVLDQFKVEQTSAQTDTKKSVEKDSTDTQETTPIAETKKATPKKKAPAKTKTKSKENPSEV